MGLVIFAFGFFVCRCGLSIQAHRSPGRSGVQPDDLPDRGVGWVGKLGLDIPGVQLCITANVGDFADARNID